MGQALKMQHRSDPRADTLVTIGDTSQIDVMHNQILVAIYKRPERTAGGIILTDTTRKEDTWQGKVGLVLKKGPLAFKDDGITKFAGQDVQEGDWVFFRVSDGWSLTIGKGDCRMLEDVHIKGRIPSPDYVY